MIESSQMGPAPENSGKSSKNLSNIVMYIPDICIQIGSEYLCEILNNAGFVLIFFSGLVFQFLFSLIFFSFLLIQKFWLQKPA